MSSARAEQPGQERAAGDFLRLQRDLAQGHALVRDEHSSLITVSGPDRLTWLNSLITQDVLGLAPHQTLESLLLSPQGRIEHAFFLSDDGLTTWILTSAEHAEGLEAWLRSMVFRMDVSIDRPENVDIVATTSKELLSGLGALMVFSDPWPRVGSGSVGYAEGLHPGNGWELHWAVIQKGTRVSSEVLPAEHLEALSIAAARPTVKDVDETTLPHELDWLRTAVHLNKGCYRGQETVAKVHNLGHPPRRITLLHLDGSQSLLPQSGDEVRLGDKRVGHITRAAWHYELGPIALALIKRTTPVDQPLSVVTEGSLVGASQEVIVPVDAGGTRNVPRLGRLR
ncbi:MAG: YgfZ/GcvT domain-containing protein [Pontimonas sp.]